MIHDPNNPFGTAFQGHSPKSNEPLGHKSFVKSAGGGGAPRKKVEPEPEEPEPEPRSPEPKVKADEKPVAKLSNPKWDREKGICGKIAIASVDVELPPEKKDVTKVVFTVEEILANGKFGKPSHFSVFAKDGKAECEITLPEPVKLKDGTDPKHTSFRFTAKHSYSEILNGPKLPADAGDGLDRFACSIFYSPRRGEYLCFETEEEYQTLLEEASAIESLKGMTLKLLEAKGEDHEKLSKKVDENKELLFDGEAIGDPDVLEELLEVRRNPRWGKNGGWLYIRPNAKKNGKSVKGHWRKEKDEKLKENLKDLLKRAPGSKEHSPFMSKKIKLKLFSVDPLEGQWPIKWKYPNKHTEEKKEGGSEGKSFEFTPQAAFGRYSLGWEGVEGEIDLNEKKITIGTSGHASYGLFEGKAEFAYFLPEKGVNLLEYVADKSYADDLVLKGRACLLRMKVGLSATAFLGVTVSAALNPVNIDFSKEKIKPKTNRKEERKTSKVSSTVGVGGFAGGQAGVGIELSSEWSRGARGEFKSLGMIGAKAHGSLGGGAKFEWTIGYESGNFRMKWECAACWGFGAGGAYEAEIDVEEGWHLIGTLMNAMDFHCVKEIKAEAFKAYSDFAFTLMTLGEKALTAELAVVENVITDFKSWLDKVPDFTKVKSFLFTSSIHNPTLTKVPPEALGQALLTIMKTREESDFRSIMSILYSTLRPGANVKIDPSANHKLKWTIRFASGTLGVKQTATEPVPSKDEALKLGIKKILDFGKGIEYFNPDGSPHKYFNLDGSPQEKNDAFLRDIHQIFRENGIS